VKIPTMLRYLLSLAATLIVSLYGAYCYSAKGVTPITRTVQINSDCSVTPNTPDAGTIDDEAVFIDDTLIFGPPTLPTGHTYSANFSSSPFSGSTVNAGPPGKVVRGTVVCNKLTVGINLINKNYCHFSYNLIKGNNLPCKDPGVHVVPPSVSFYRWLRYLAKKSNQ
jgi:hypothetical protein